MSLLEGFRAVSFKSYLLDLLDAIASLQEVDSSLARTMQSYGTIGCKKITSFSLVQAGSNEAEMRASLDEKLQLIETLREQVL